MKFASFELHGERGYGAVIDDRIVRLDRQPNAPKDLRSFLATYNESEWPSLPAGQEVELVEVRLLPPIPNPKKIICVATNFHEPSRAGKPDPDFPLVFTRFAESLTGHGRQLISPEVSRQFDFEGELAVVIGRPGHKIRREEAMDFVAGYSCFNDGSVRDWQKHSSQFTPGKNFLHSGSMGPWLVTKDEIEDFGGLTLRTKVNGEIKQSISMRQMIFDVPWLISYFSTFIPLSPGDIIATGTPSGFGSSRNPPEFLNEGDVVEVDISGIGTLSNTVS